MKLLIFSHALEIRPRVSSHLLTAPSSLELSVLLKNSFIAPIMLEKKPFMFSHAILKVSDLANVLMLSKIPLKKLKIESAYPGILFTNGVIHSMNELKASPIRLIISGIFSVAEENTFLKASPKYFLIVFQTTFIGPEMLEKAVFSLSQDLEIASQILESSTPFFILFHKEEKVISFLPESSASSPKPKKFKIACPASATTFLIGAKKFLIFSSDFENHFDSSTDFFKFTNQSPRAAPSVKKASTRGEKILATALATPHKNLNASTPIFRIAKNPLAILCTRLRVSPNIVVYTVVPFSILPMPFFSPNTSPIFLWTSEL